MKKQWGVSLLEILLVVVIAAVIVSLSVRYFTTASNNAEYVAIKHKLENILHAGYTLKDSQKAPDYSNVTTDTLKAAGFLTNENDVSTQWGDIQVNPDKTKNLVITLPTPNEHQCCLLATHLHSIMDNPKEKDECGKDESTQCTQKSGGAILYEGQLASGE